MYKIFALVCILALSLPLFAFPAHAKAPPDSLPHARAYILMEARTGEVLLAHNENEPLPVSSLAKIMSLLIIAEELAAGRITLDEQVPAPSSVAGARSPVIWLNPGEVMTLGELTKAVVMSSSNDAMLALAEYVAGSDEGFTELMNRRALELGMNDTFFADSGGYNEDSLSSARDAAVMTAALFELGFEHGALTKSFTTRLSAVREGTERETQLVNTNGLAHWFEGVLGGKAAHSAASGFCLTNAAERGNMRLTAVVLGAGNEDDRVNLSELLLESGFKDFEFVTPDIDPALLTPVRVERGVERFVGVKPANPIRFIAAKGSGSGAKFDVTLPQTLPAPVGAGQVVGKLTVRLGEKTVAEYDLIAVAAVQELSFTKSVEIMLRRFFRL